jgi:hypothetical protein
VVLGCKKGGNYWVRYTPWWMRYPAEGSSWVVGDEVEVNDSKSADGAFLFGKQVGVQTVECLVVNKEECQPSSVPLF